MAKKKAAKKTSKKASKKNSAKGKEDDTYVVYARRFRPQTFADVVGQETVTGAIRHALRTKRIAQAYLFSGPRGVGKTSLARIFAKALNCENGTGEGYPEEPCNECPSCESITEGSALDVIEMDAATNRGINEIRDLRDAVGLSPVQLSQKVYIVDEVHMLTNEAWNAFLKTLEEPPPHVKFVFATTDPDKIPETIISRCQRFDLRRIGLKDIVKRLAKICEEEQVDYEEAALDRLAGLAKGGLRDAEGMLDQAVNLGEGSVTDEVVRQIAGAVSDDVIFEMLTACAEGRVADALTTAGDAVEAGAAPDDVLREVLERLRGTLLAKTCGVDSNLLEGQSHLKEPYAELAGKLNEDQLLMLLQLFSSAQRQVKDAAQARLPLEMALVRASRAGELVDLGKIVAALESGASVGPPGGSRPMAAGGLRPNASGRQGGEPVNLAASPTEEYGATQATPRPLGTRSASAVSSPQNSLSASTPVISTDKPERWSDLLLKVRETKGKGMIAVALNHAAPVKLDQQNKTLSLGFTRGQSTYKVILERKSDQEILQAALDAIYGGQYEISFETVEGKPRASVKQVNAGAERTSRTPKFVEPKKVPKKKLSAPPSTSGKGAVEESYIDEGALPLPEPPPDMVQEEDEGGILTSDEELGPARVADGIETRNQMAKMKSSTELKPEDASFGEILEHPLVKMVVEQFEGQVMRVERRGPADLESDEQAEGKKNLPANAASKAKSSKNNATKKKTASK